MGLWGASAGGSQKRGSAIVLFVATVILAGLGFWRVAPLGESAEMWGAASMASGAAVGFLFGLPRTVQKKRDSAKEGAAAEDGSPDYAQLVNNNLEELSDWLTKILVGLGLTQLARVPSKLQAAAAYIASGLRDPATAAVGASAMIVYFSILGFLSAYLLMRLAAAPALRAADVDLARRIDQVDAKTDTLLGRANSAVQRVQDAVQRADQAVLNTLIESALADLRRDPPRDSSVEEDIRALEPLLPHYPTDRRLHLVLGRLYDQLRRYDQSIPLLTSFLEAKSAAGETTDPDFADALYNRACSYSLKSGVTAEKAEREKLQRLVLEDLKKSIELLPPLVGRCPETTSPSSRQS